MVYGIDAGRVVVGHRRFRVGAPSDRRGAAHNRCVVRFLRGNIFAVLCYIGGGGMMVEITLIDQGTMLVSGATATMGKEITLINGRTFDRRTKAWRVPIAGLFAVVAACGVQNVSIDYAVLVAQDEQLRRMVRQYRAIGVDIWMDNGRVMTSNPLLTEVLQPLRKLLWWLPTAPRGELAERPSRQRPDVEQLALIVDGVNNAAECEEREKTLRRKRRWARRGSGEKSNGG